MREVLFRPLYRGEIVWNRTRKRNRWGEARVADRPESEWMHIPAPELRIVSEELWAAAHARIDASRAHYQAVTKGSRIGRPRDVESKYLLPGFARCSSCNGGLHVRSTHHGTADPRRRVFFYACTSHYNRGPEVCANGLMVRMDAVDEAVLGSLEGILTPDLVDDVVARVRELLDPGARQSERRDDLEARLAAADRPGHAPDRRDRDGWQPETFVAKLQEADRTRQALATQLDAVAGDSGPFESIGAP